MMTMTMMLPKKPREMSSICVAACRMLCTSRSSPLAGEKTVVVEEDGLASRSNSVVAPSTVQLLLENSAFVVVSVRMEEVVSGGIFTENWHNLGVMHFTK
jgi:hypothetical protein